MTRTRENSLAVWREKEERNANENIFYEDDSHSFCFGMLTSLFYLLMFVGNKMNENKNSLKSNCDSFEVRAFVSLFEIN